MSSIYEQQYRDQIETVLRKGKWELNKRTGVRCLTIPTYIMEYKLDEKSAPLLQGRPSYPVSACAEILGYNRQYTNAQDFADIGSPSWFKNSNETLEWLKNPHRKGENDLGVVYGAALNREHIYKVWKDISEGKDDRGLKLNWWQPDSFSKACLRPCLSDHQFMLVDDKVNITSVSRSQDVMCGGNFNSLQVYFQGMLAKKLSGLEGGVATHVMNHVHIYEKHIEGVEEYLDRDCEILNTTFIIADWVKTAEDIMDVDNHAREYFTLEGYKGLAQPRIDFEMIA